MTRSSANHASLPKVPTFSAEIIAAHWAPNCATFSSPDRFRTWVTEGLGNSGRDYGPGSLPPGVLMLTPSRPRGASDARNRTGCAVVERPAVLLDQRVP